jgi:hypothetical protein
MTESIVYIPFSRDLYNDIIRFSDGGLDPATLAESQVRSWVERSIEFGWEDNWSEGRLEEVAEKYAPQVLEGWRREDADQLRQRSAEKKPLVWKEISIASGSEVRMFYNGEQHYAAVKGGKIIDDEGKDFTPSEWASKVAGGTSRNAWRDLWFKEPLTRTWVPAQMLRDQAQQEHRRVGRPPALQEVAP